MHPCTHASMWKNNMPDFQNELRGRFQKYCTHKGMQHINTGYKDSWTEDMIYETRGYLSY